MKRFIGEGCDQCLQGYTGEACEQCIEGISGESCNFLETDFGTFRLILPGTFTMGSPTEEEGHGTDEISHQVQLTRPFWMQTTEVTQAEFRVLVDKSPSFFSDCDQCPVEGVSWNEANR